MTAKLTLAVAFATLVFGRDRVAYIEFFGYGGIDVAAVRRALPFHEGDPRPKSIRAQAEEAVRRVTGRGVTDVAQICCVGDGDGAIFIGLRGNSTRVVAYNPAPTADAPPPRKLVVLYRKMDAAEQAAMKAGVFEEEGKPGYRLSKEPAAATAQLALRACVLGHEDEVIRTLEGDRRPHNRALAADALGYGARTHRQIAALARASHDSDDEVRNNATRALGEILRSDPNAPVPYEPFIELLHSGVWTDRNKAAFVLFPLTQRRDPRVLERLNSEARDALKEMAGWRSLGWALGARAILGRIAGWPEERVEILSEGPPDAFFSALGR